MRELIIVGVWVAQHNHRRRHLLAGCLGQLRQAGEALDRDAKVRQMARQRRIVATQGQQADRADAGVGNRGDFHRWGGVLNNHVQPGAQLVGKMQVGGVMALVHAVMQKMHQPLGRFREARQLARVGHALEIQRQIQHMGGQRGVPVRGQRCGGGFQFGGARRQRGGIGQVHGRAFAANEADAFI